ncbi:MAG: M15 family metallopeptidase [Gammaproteobacteria bacterium]|nr:M15 family metallopeptidase [Gammaproteobacteria bacterium]
MKTQAVVGLSCVLLLSCASPDQQKEQPKAQQKIQQKSQPASAAVAQTVQPQGPFRIEAKKPTDIVNVLTVTSKVQVNMAYAGTRNFTGTVVPGYQVNSCYLEKKAAEALAKVAQQAERLGYQLEVLDCYRPQRASSYFMNWVANAVDQKTKAAYYPRIDKSELKQGYIAAYSGHSRASTVDLTLLQKNAANQWSAVDMGGAYDLFDSVSHLNSAEITAQQKANRLLLKDLMQQQGFAPYEMEWWHFSLQDETYPYTYFDFLVN